VLRVLRFDDTKVRWHPAATKGKKSHLLNRKKIMFGSEMVFFEFFFLPFLSKNLFLKTNPLRLEGVC
jgi:hypothetical protein